MKRNIPIIGVVFILLASACAPQGTPTANPVDVQHTAEAAALTMVAETMQAVPTATPIPPTATASPTPAATNTPIPLPTSGTPGTLEATVTLPVNAPTFTQQAPPSSGGSGDNQDNCNQLLSSWQGPTANFSIANQSQPQGTIVLSMYVETEFGQCGFLNTAGGSFSGPIGQYTAAAFITGRQNFKAFGSFRITEGNWNIVVRNDSILARGGCSPNC